MDQNFTEQIQIRATDACHEMDVSRKVSVDYNSLTGQLSQLQVHASGSRKHSGSSSVSRSGMDLDLNGGSNRRSRHFAVSDTTDLTSPFETEVVRSKSSISGYHSGQEGDMSKNDTTSELSSVSHTVPQSPHLDMVVSPPADDPDKLGDVLRIFPAQGADSVTAAEAGDSFYRPKSEHRTIETKLDMTPDLPARKPITKQPQINNATKKNKLIMLRIPRDSSFRNFARQISKKKRYDVADASDFASVGVLKKPKRPKSYFDLAIVTLCCCCSVFGFVSVIFSVLSESNFKSKHMRKAKKYGKVSMIISIIGMISSVAIAITLLLVFAYPWEHIVDL